MKRRSRGRRKSDEPPSPKRPDINDILDDLADVVLAERGVGEDWKNDEDELKAWGRPRERVFGIIHSESTTITPGQAQTHAETQVFGRETTSGAYEEKHHDDALSRGKEALIGAAVFLATALGTTRYITLELNQSVPVLGNHPNLAGLAAGSTLTAVVLLVRIVRHK